MKHKRRRDGVGQMEFANGFVGAVVVDEAVDHHLLLLVGEGADAGEDCRLVDDLGGDLRRLGLVCIRGLLRLRADREPIPLGGVGEIYVFIKA